jgi:hypothetical protein
VGLLSLPSPFPAHVSRPVQGRRKQSLVQRWKDVVKVFFSAPSDPVGVVQHHDFHVELAAAVRRCTCQPGKHATSDSSLAAPDQRHLLPAIIHQARLLRGLSVGSTVDADVVLGQDNSALELGRSRVRRPR